MDQVYRGQRHIYDATRKYFLFGRDKLIAGLNVRPGAAVLELACGTGRNLAAVGRQWPGVSLCGLDISSEMLRSAEAKLRGEAQLARGDATRFDPLGLFDRDRFDAIVLSYALSMIPDWRGVIDQALGLLTPGGSLHIIDFGDLGGMPLPLRIGLRAWLARFHVEPRADLPDHAVSAAARRRFRSRCRQGPFGYYWLIRVTRPR
jgi:S-adenosylmethionine-diacylgycerolhomoserine-N-methlytransferase